MVGVGVVVGVGLLVCVGFRVGVCAAERGILPASCLTSKLSVWFSSKSVASTMSLSTSFVGGPLFKGMLTVRKALLGAAVACWDVVLNTCASKSLTVMVLDTCTTNVHILSYFNKANKS